jgi:predicted amidophosphoribosyltransferase
MGQNAPMNYAELKEKYPFTPSKVSDVAKETWNTSPNRRLRKISEKQFKRKGGLTTEQKAVKSRKERKRLNKAFRLAAKINKFLTRK